ncbi:MAG: virulence factor TspB C-terminal domain-related protein [Opitutus sp.]
MIWKVGFFSLQFLSPAGLCSVIRLLSVLLLLFGFLAVGQTMATTVGGCSISTDGGSAVCDTKTHAQTWIASKTDHKGNICPADQPFTFAVIDYPQGKSIYKNWACGYTPTFSDYTLYVASYTTNDQCDASKPPHTIDQWSTGSNDDIPSGGTQCDNGCVATWTPNGAPHWVLAFQRFTVQGTLQNTGDSCAVAPPTVDPGTAPPDADHDGIPDTVDPYPNDPGNNPPPAPSSSSSSEQPKTPPTPDTGTGGATGAQIGHLETTITDGFINMGIKLDGVYNALLAVKVGADLNSSQEVAAIQAGANLIANAVTAAGGGSSGVTDMGPTNALLSTGNTQRALISSSLSDVDSLLQHQFTSTANDLHGSLTVPTAGQSAGFIDVSSGSVGDGGADGGGTGFGWSRSCPSNPSFSVFGHSFIIDLSLMCSWMSLGGALVMISAGLMCVRIVAGGVS